FLAARRIRRHGGGEIRRKDEGHDQRVEGWLRPIEQHPAPDAAPAGAQALSRVLLQTVRSAIIPAATLSRETVISPPSVNDCSRSRARTTRSPPASAHCPAGSSASP